MSKLQIRLQGDATILEWVDGGTLLSRAELRFQTLLRPPLTYRICRLGAVFTPPEQRRAGHARRLIAQATAYIQGMAVDLAILDCRPDLIPLYAFSGWQLAEAAAPPASPVTAPAEEPFFIDMVLWCSAQAPAAYAALTQAESAPGKSSGGG